MIKKNKNDKEVKPEVPDEEEDTLTIEKHLTDVRGGVFPPSRPHPAPGRATE